MTGCFLLSNAGDINGQDISFSQFYANRLYLNPSMAGIERDTRRLFINYRNQWPALGKTYRTYSASYDQYIPHLNGGIGFQVLNDLQGDGTFSHYAMNIDYSYHIKISRELQINGGIEAGIVQKAVSVENLVFEDMINPTTGETIYGITESISGTYRIYPDFAVGTSAFYRNYYGGLALSHLFRPYGYFSSTENARLARKLTAFAGAIIPVYEKRLGKEVLQLSPNFIFLKQKTYTQFLYGLEGVYQNQLIGGLWFRQNLGIEINSIIFSAGYVTESFRIRYSYDRHLSPPDVKLPVLGAHEVSLVVSFRNVKKIKHKAIKCPKI